MPARGPPATQAERAARRAAGTIRPGSPGTGRPSARGLAPAGRGRRTAGVRGEIGARAAWGPPGSGPCWSGTPRGAPGPPAKDGKGGEVEPFCFAGPALLAAPGRRATSAAATAAPGSARRGRRGAGARGPGPGAGAGRAGHFLCPAALPRAPLPPRPPGGDPGPPAAPAGAALFGWGEPKGKSFAGGAGEGAPRASRDPARRRGRRAAAVASSPSCSAAEGKRLSFPPACSSPRPGASWAEARARRGLIQREAPRRGWPPAAHAAPRRREAAGLGARRGHRRPRRHTLARTHSGASRFAAADGHGRRACVLQACGDPPPPPSTFSGGSPSSSWLQGSPC